MKNRSFRRGPYYFFKQRNPSEGTHAMLELVTPPSKSEKNKDLFDNILRWEDDGGKIVEAAPSTLELFFVQPVRQASHHHSVFRHAAGKGDTQ